jgi:hypothetical protein
MASDQTILTKYGRVTSQEWLLLQQRERIAKWLPDHKLHLVLIRAPFKDPSTGIEITDPEFERLLDEDPEAAQRQLQREFDADRAMNLEADRQREIERRRDAQHLRSYVTGKRRSRSKRKHSPQLSLIT